MRRARDTVRRIYGERPFHLMVMAAALALTAYVIATVGPEDLLNRRVWWQSIAVWFAAAVIAHDLVLFPLYALADRILAGPRARRARPRQRPPVVNYVRIPTMATGLTFVIFLPGIIEQGAPAYQAATGLTQAPYLSRWLLLTAGFYLTSAMCYTVRNVIGRRRTHEKHTETADSDLLAVTQQVNDAGAAE